MDEQNYNDQNGQSLRANGSVAESDNENLKKYLKVLAIFVVFAACFSIPFYCSYLTQKGAKVAMIKMDASQLRNWAQIYRLNNGSYIGLENDYEFSRVIEGAKRMNGEAVVYTSADSYCSVLSLERESFCTDSSGFVGKDEGVCSPDSVKCN